MKLNCRTWQARACVLNICIMRIDEQQHRRNKGRKPARQLCRSSSCDIPRTGRVHHKPHSISARCRCGFYVFFAGQTTNLDPASFFESIHPPDYGNQSKAGVRVGKP